MHLRNFKVLVVFDLFLHTFFTVLAMLLVCHKIKFSFYFNCYELVLVRESGNLIITIIYLCAKNGGGKFI